MNLPSIPEYFKGKNIFITGGSGFIGKVLIEKLLYSCPELEHIYLLMRAKKDVKPVDRITALYKFQCFDRLRKEKPGLFESKVKVITGDIGETSLGISEADKALIIKTANIVFHTAASVRFNDHLIKAVKLNLRGTKELIELAKEMQNLESFLHVSTAFSNSHKDLIEEVMYPPLGDWRVTLEICESLDSHSLQVLTSKFIEGIPNTYLLTKHLTEHMICEQKGKLPIIIYRPSVVISSADEPLPGWVDNLNGPNGLSAATASGIVRSLYGKPDVVLDMIPVDLVVKGAIVAAWNRGAKKLEVTDNIPIYNACDCGLSPMTLERFVDFGVEVLNTYPLGKMLWIPNVHLESNIYKYYLKVLIFQLLPALFIDTLLRIFRMKPVLLKLQYRIFTANISIHPYVSRQWNFANKNYLALRSKVLEKDRSNFYYDTNVDDESEYMVNYILGGKRFLFNEKDEDLPKHRRNLRRMIILDKIFKYAFYVFLLWWIINKSYAMFQA